MFTLAKTYHNESGRTSYSIFHNDSMVAWLGFKPDSSIPAMERMVKTLNESPNKWSEFDNSSMMMMAA